jgi:hypothetical protein
MFEAIKEGDRSELARLAGHMKETSSHLEFDNIIRYAEDIESSINIGSIEEVAEIHSCMCRDFNEIVRKLDAAG